MAAGRRHPKLTQHCTCPLFPLHWSAEGTAPAHGSQWTNSLCGSRQLAVHDLHITVPSPNLSPLHRSAEGTAPSHGSLSPSLCMTLATTQLTLTHHLAHTLHPLTSIQASTGHTACSWQHKTLCLHGISQHAVEALTPLRPMPPSVQASRQLGLTQHCSQLPQPFTSMQAGRMRSACLWHCSLSPQCLLVAEGFKPSPLCRPAGCAAPARGSRVCAGDSSHTFPSRPPHCSRTEQPCPWR